MLLILAEAYHCAIDKGHIEAALDCSHAIEHGRSCQLIFLQLCAAFCVDVHWRTIRFRAPTHPHPSEVLVSCSIARCSYAVNGSSAIIIAMYGSDGQRSNV